LSPKTRIIQASRTSFKQVAAVVFMVIPIAGLFLLPNASWTKKYKCSSRTLLVSLIFLVLPVALLLLLVNQNREQSVFGMAVVALGIPNYRCLKLNERLRKTLLGSINSAPRSFLL